MGLYDNYALPTHDGDTNFYVNLEAEASGSFQAGRSAIFVNGMDNSPEDHRQSAVELSLMLMMPIYGVYNQTEGKGKDLWQCVVDKYQFTTPMLAIDAVKNLPKNVIEYLKNGGAINSQTNAFRAVRDALASNPAALELFLLLRNPSFRDRPIFAHSQGNLIVSNALSAISIVDGPEAVVGREVHSYGSPSVYWPPGLKHQEYAFTGDGVALLAGFDFGFRISKLGLHSWDKNAGKADANGKKLKPSVDWGLISHGFMIYMHNDPEFVVNRFRTGSFGMTFNMDEAGLANALLDMGRNTPRVKRIFEHLDKHRNSDADDVALLYVDAMRNDTRKHTHAIRALQLNGAFRKMLIRIMDEGWTSSKEHAAIKWLKGDLFV